MRWHPRHLGKAASWLEWIYDGLSRYGQSVARPIVGLFVSTLVFARILFDLATQAPKQGVWMFGEALSASIANTLPFIPSVRAVRIDALDTLFGQDPSFWVDIMNIGQGAVSFVFLFLIGLGLRNRFRL
ncbi:hypothetical protein [Thalassobaculum salexigens]|uniref:hypothetical protein n=1 Tax=Thalassobaculum salexigens TaxID=455360 RepID=UPI0012EC08FE|nr:hypothetical protein [Thalassobaculum salexigens]